MGRVAGLEKKQPPWHLRWFYGVMRKMFGKDFTPTKIQMCLPCLVWGGIALEAVLGRKRLVSSQGAPNGADGLPLRRDRYHLLDDFKPFQTVPDFALISSTSSSGVRPKSIVITSSSGCGSSKSAN
jgi:hypothetical protein